MALQTDLERRAQLRAFLMYLRSRLSPAEVGLPQAGGRRVAGLRRQEVAELIGTSEDWYRWFESGRPISVSPKFLARLSEALHLNAYDQVTLYRLALPELFRAEAVVTVEFPSSLPSNLSAIALPSDIDQARRTFDSARVAFLASEAKDLEAIRSRILGSWERSRSLHVDAETMQVPLALETGDSLSEACEENHWLLAAARPLVTHLRTVLGELGYAIAITDRRACVLEVDGDSDARRLVGRVGILPGGDMSEDAVGTNGIGTVIADYRPLQIMAAEHLIEGFQPLACTGAPIRDPHTGVISGVLVVMSDYKLVRPTLLPAVIRCALEIEEEMAKDAGATALLSAH